MPPDLIKPIIDPLSKNVVSDVYGGIKRWFAKLDPGELKLKDYHSGLLSSLGFIQIMGMTSPRKLENIYVGIRALPDLKKNTNQLISQRSKPEVERNIVEARKVLYSREVFNIERFIADIGYDDIDIEQVTTTNLLSPEEDMDFESSALDNEGTQENKRSLHPLEFLKRHKKLVVLGAPGSGKTTLLKYFALVYSGHLAPPGGSPVDSLLPIFVPLREVKRVGAPSPTADWLRELALNCATDISPKVFAKEWLEEALNKGRCLVLLDGVDEAPPALLNTIFQSIKAFASKYRKNTIVITCRAAAFDRSIEGFQICEIDDFNKDDIELFVRQWYDNDSPSSASVIKDIFSSTLAIELCHTPLLLTLICILYNYRRTIPANRAELYEYCVDALLFRWDTSRSVDRVPLLATPIDPNRKKLLLARVAYRAFDKDFIYFEEATLRELIQVELNYLDLREISPDILLKEIESHNGLLLEFSPGVYCFSHLTFHEYFTALYYYDSQNYAELFNKSIRDSKYMEVFLMCIEKMYKADSLIMPLISHVKNVCIDRNIYNEYLHALVQNVLSCKVFMDPRLRAILKELKISLEQLEIDDQILAIVAPGEGDQDV